MKLNNKIINSCLEADTLKKSAKLLGIARGNVFELENEDTISVLFDFALNDYILSDGRNTVAVYSDEIGYEDKVEKEILVSLTRSYTSLFKITSVSDSDNVLALKDLLNGLGVKKLIDYGLSNTAYSGLLLFTRFVPFGEHGMTSGIGLIFAEEDGVIFSRGTTLLPRKSAPPLIM